MPASSTRFHYNDLDSPADRARSIHAKDVHLSHMDLSCLVVPIVLSSRPVLSCLVARCFTAFCNRAERSSGSRHCTSSASTCTIIHPPSPIPCIPSYRRDRQRRQIVSTGAAAHLAKCAHQYRPFPYSHPSHPSLPWHLSSSQHPHRPAMHTSTPLYPVQSSSAGRPRQ